MIINRVTLKNWNVFREETQLDLGPGLNVIVGPNESGKSTVRDTLVRAFFAKHTGTSAAQDYVPWGTKGLSPEVQVEFESGGRTLKATKRFIKDKDSRLEVLEGEKWTLIAAGDEADAQVASILEGAPPPKVLKPENLGLVKALWSPQGNLATIEDLGDRARGRLMAEIGGVITTEEENALIKQLNSELGARLQKKRRVPKAGSELAIVTNEMEQFQERLAEIQERIGTRDQLAKELDKAEAELQKREVALKTTIQELVEAVAAAEKALERKRVREGMEADIRELTREWESIDNRVKRIEGLLKNERGLVEAGREDAPKVDDLKQRLTTVREEITQLIDDVSSAEDNLSELDDSLINARIARDVQVRRKELGDIEQVLERVGGIEEKINGLSEELESLEDVNEKTVKALEGKDSEYKKLQGRLEAQGLTVNLSPMVALKGSVFLDEGEEQFDLKKGTIQKWKASQRVQFTVPKVLDIEVVSGSEDVKELSKDLETMRKDIQSELARFHASDLDDMRSMFGRKRVAEERLAQLQEELSHHAPKGPASIRKKVKSLESTIASDIGKLPDGYHERERATSEDIEHSLDELGTIITNIEDERRRTNSTIHGLKKKEKELKGIETDLDNQIKELRERGIDRDVRLELIQKELGDLRSDGLEDEERTASRDSSAAELELARAALKGLEADVNEKEERPLRRLEEVRKAQQEHNEKIAELSTNAGELRGSIERMASEGDYTRVDELEASLHELERRQEALDIEARAIALLVDLMEHHRTKTIRDVSGPVREIVDENLERLVGHRYGGIELDDMLVPCGVKVDGEEECPKLERLSHGTREQLGMLVRLAVAEVMAREEPVPVILDDPLAHTDSARRYVALDILREAAGKLQVIVLTCHPEDYAGLDMDNMIDLGKQK